MSIDLQRYCASEYDPRKYLRAPWLAGEWVYATNGHLAVRVPAASRPDITATPEKAPNVGALFDMAFDRAGEFAPIPDVKKTQCSHCGGTGRLWAINCPDCDKDTPGEFEHGSYTYDCKNCEDSAAGKGWVEVAKEDRDAQSWPCERCDGVGLCRDDSAERIGGAHYATRYLAMLSALPGARIRPGDPAPRDYGAKVIPALVTFDGGHALLMPRRD